MVYVFAPIGFILSISCLCMGKTSGSICCSYSYIYGWCLEGKSAHSFYMLSTSIWKCQRKL